MDETWINAGHTMAKVWRDKSITSTRDAFNRGLSCGLKDPNGKGKRLIIVHIGSNDGFVPNGLFVLVSSKTGDYHKDMNSEVFESWLKDILPELEPDSVIVLDNAPYHSCKLDKNPTSNDTKARIIQWLATKGVEADHSFLKAELLEKVESLNLPMVYVVDDITKSSGQHVLRLPPYHCALNAIELIWADIKGFVTRYNSTFKFDDMKEFTRSCALQQMSELGRGL